MQGAGRDAVGKVAVVGVKDRATKQVRAKVVESTDKPTLQRFVAEHTAPGATVYTDEASAYEGLPFKHESVKHSVSAHVRGMVHTNSAEPFWSMLKRAHMGTFHKLGPKHLECYARQFADKQNFREFNTVDQLGAIASSMTGKHLPYEKLIASNGLSSGTRSGQAGVMTTECPHCHRQIEGTSSRPSEDGGKVVPLRVVSSRDESLKAPWRVTVYNI